MLKALDISIAIARVAPDVLKAPVVLSDTTVGRFAIDWEDLKPYWFFRESSVQLYFAVAC